MYIINNDYVPLTESGDLFVINDTPSQALSSVLTVSENISTVAASATTGLIYLLCAADKKIYRVDCNTFQIVDVVLLNSVISGSTFYMKVDDINKLLYISNCSSILYVYDLLTLSFVKTYTITGFGYFRNFDFKPYTSNKCIVLGVFGTGNLAVLDTITNAQSSYIVPGTAYYLFEVACDDTAIYTGGTHGSGATFVIDPITMSPIKSSANAQINEYSYCAIVDKYSSNNQLLVYSSNTGTIMAINKVSLTGNSLIKISGFSGMITTPGINRVLITSGNTLYSYQ